MDETTKISVQRHATTPAPLPEGFHPRGELICELAPRPTGPRLRLAELLDRLEELEELIPRLHDERRQLVEKLAANPSIQRVFSMAIEAPRPKERGIPGLPATELDPGADEWTSGAAPSPEAAKAQPAARPARKAAEAGLELPLSELEELVRRIIGTSRPVTAAMVIAKSLKSKTAVYSALQTLEARGLVARGEERGRWIGVAP